jgi:hypothetical protein
VEKYNFAIDIDGEDFYFVQGGRRADLQASRGEGKGVVIEVGVRQRIGLLNPFLHPLHGTELYAMR